MIHFDYSVVVQHNITMFHVPVAPYKIAFKFLFHPTFSHYYKRLSKETRDSYCTFVASTSFFLSCSLSLSLSLTQNPFYSFDSFMCKLIFSLLYFLPSFVITVPTIHASTLKPENETKSNQFLHTCAAPL